LPEKHLAQTTTPHKSLTQLCVEFEDALRTPEGSDIDSLYIRLYQQHFGSTPRHAKATQYRDVLKWVQKFCVSEGIDPAMWITAQMHGLKAWFRHQQKKSKKIVFLPTMLRGVKAKARYNIYTRMAQRQYRRVAADSFDEWTDEGALLARLTGVEEQIGDYYVRVTMQGGTPTLEDAVDHVSLDMYWASVFLDIKAEKGLMQFFKHRTLLRRRFGADRLKQLKQVARIRAAFNVAERFCHGLPDSIGVAEGVEVEWKALARLLCRLKPEVKQREKVVDMDSVSGVLWGGSYGG
jgi:hypothetical protein